MGFDLTYPTTGTPTSTFSIASCPALSPHREAHGPPAIVREMPDSTFRAYRLASDYDQYDYTLIGIDDAAKATLVTFFKVVYAGIFKVDDPKNGTYTGQFHPDTLRNGLTGWTLQDSGKWSVPISIVKRAA